MKLKTITIYAVVSIPVLLIINIYIDYKNRHNHLEQCPENESCVRYCCENEISCENDTSVDLKQFNFSQNLRKYFKYLKGEACPQTQAFDAFVDHTEFLDVCILYLKISN